MANEPIDPRETERGLRTGTSEISHAIDCDMDESCTCGVSEHEHPALANLRAERVEKWAALQSAGGGVELANAIEAIDERIEEIGAGGLRCRECGSDRIVAWYPEYARQAIEMFLNDDGTVGYDYTGEDYDHADDAGSDDEYWCLDCEAHSHDLDYLVGVRVREEIIRNDEAAMLDIARMLDGYEWSSAANYLEAIAGIMRSAGHKVREPIAEWETEELEAEKRMLEATHSQSDREKWDDYSRERILEVEECLAERSTT